MEVSDINIVKKYRGNAHQGLELLYNKYKKYVYAIAYRYTGTKEDALDLTQEVFISLFKSMGSLKEDFSVLPWVRRVTVNRCLNFVRDKKDTVSLNQTTEDGSEMQEFIPSDESTENRVVCRDIKECMERAINELPDRERMAVLLRHMKGMKYEEVSKTMNLPLGTVKTLLHKGRKIIKEHLAREGVWEV
ncbi:RNA polymerase RpoE-like sigma-24 subunit [Anaerobacterium chartisolvens]|uniref:RNA polymerase RpoE-like sigma-24 subunit n=1 Tax=Anaerobacterium chartisolvens TaxID=1297424 RepID=A0A369B5I1_9FIRM|nr:RNA polymerase sigma factor [Anaerobacterium chartisolvens]RCX16575.1 RNA polymerase RpoE-like sigma-24 subunit [Anaerobacterium chartisolvens]